LPFGTLLSNAWSQLVVDFPIIPTTMLPTYRPHKRKRAKTIGFRARMKTAGGRKVLKARRFKGRHSLTHKQA
jgi:large subunit ribosomal protein L34